MLIPLKLFNLQYLRDKKNVQLKARMSKYVIYLNQTFNNSQLKNLRKTSLDYFVTNYSNTIIQMSNKISFSDSNKLVLLWSRKHNHWFVVSSLSWKNVLSAVYVKQVLCKIQTFKSTSNSF